MEIKLPNFLIVGATKSGTTSLYFYLKQHPEVYMPKIKETRFFVSSVYSKMNENDPRYRFYKKTNVFTYRDYLELFRDVKCEIAIGEATPQYLYHYEIAIPQIKKYLGDVKIIVILRNPIERAFSAYNHAIRDQLEGLSFERCLEIEEERRNSNWSSYHFYKDIGFYYNQVNAYIKNFSKIKIALYDDLKNDTLFFVKDIYQFLEVDYSFQTDVSQKYNVSGTPKNEILQKIIIKPNLFKSIIKPMIRIFPKDKRTRLRENIITRNLIRPEMKPETYHYLGKIYDEEISKTQDLINRDLTRWRTLGSARH